MIFANVTDITIPEGNVIKIHETNGGRVLWQKKNKIEINPVWKMVDYSIADTNSSYGVGPLRCMFRTSIYSVGGSIYISKYDIDCIGGWGRSIIDNRQQKVILKKGDIFYKPSPVPTVLKILSATNDMPGNPTNNYAGGLTYNYYPKDDKYFLSRDIYQTIDPYGVFFVETLAPISETSVFITFSPERNEYLITGLSGGRSCVLPADFTYTTTVSYLNTSPNKFLGKTYWVSDKNLYFAIGATDTFGEKNKSVYYSSDGLNWNSVKISNTKYVIGVEYLSQQEKLCAVCNNAIALSTDGITWEIKEAPFSNAIISSYCDDYDYLCVADTHKAYLTSDFNEWKEAEIPTSTAVDFRYLLYMQYGVFLGFSATLSKAKVLYALSLSVPYPLEIESPYEIT